MRRTTIRLTVALAIVTGLLGCARSKLALEGKPPWGSDHAGKPLPTFVTGDECLFCHRGPEAQTWSANRHLLTMRDLGVETIDRAAIEGLRADQQLRGLAEEVNLIVGGHERVRFLRRGEAYGTVDLLTTSWNVREKRLEHRANAHWDRSAFGERCAGCHAAAVDAKMLAFATPSLDCFSCHGEVALEHTKGEADVHLSVKRETSTPRQIISICGQCHLRGGRSKSTGRPYPNHFVAGDNLFLDFEIAVSADLANATDPVDLHILENAIDVLATSDTPDGGKPPTCVSCHRIHGSSTTRHRRLRVTRSCAPCHEIGDDGEIVGTRPLQPQDASPRSNATCEY